jgi:hypothetical protein
MFSVAGLKPRGEVIAEILRSIKERKVAVSFFYTANRGFRGGHGYELNHFPASALAWYLKETKLRSDEEIWHFFGALARAAAGLGRIVPYLIAE